MNAIFSSRFRWLQSLSARKRGVLTAFLVFSALLAVSWVVQPRTDRQIGPIRRIPAAQNSGVRLEQELKAQWDRLKQHPRMFVTAAVPPNAGVDAVIGGTDPEAPLIARAAELAITTKDFQRSRTSLEQILERHHGYAARLRMVGLPAGSTLAATLQVPASEFASAVSDLKSLGSIEREEQTADEITQRRAELEVRLTNAQRTLAGLRETASQKAKLGKQVEVARMLANVRGEIARLEAEQEAASRRVSFAQVFLTLREEVVQPSVEFSDQFRSAAQEGASDALATLSSILLFGLTRGPALILWMAIVFFPLRWFWRKWQSTHRVAPLETET